MVRGGQTTLLRFVVHNEKTNLLPFALHSGGGRYTRFRCVRCDNHANPFLGARAVRQRRFYVLVVRWGGAGWNGTAWHGMGCREADVGRGDVGRGGVKWTAKARRRVLVFGRDTLVQRGAARCAQLAVHLLGLLRRRLTQTRLPHNAKASRGFEPRSLDSESRVLTVTPRGRLEPFKRALYNVLLRGAARISQGRAPIPGFVSYVGIHWHS